MAPRGSKVSFDMRLGSQPFCRLKMAGKFSLFLSPFQTILTFFWICMVPKELFFPKMWLIRLGMPSYTIWI